MRGLEEETECSIRILGVARGDRHRCGSQEMGLEDICLQIKV